MGVWYSITLKFENFNIVFKDSLKILNFTLRQLSSVLNIDDVKGETPLLKERPKIYNLDWIDYIKKDVIILSKAIESMYGEGGFTKFTSASESLTRFKQSLNDKKAFRKIFPLLPKEIDEFLRKSYRGGWSYVKDSIKGKVINKDIVVYDINSMYPSVMLNYELPFGEPKYFNGHPTEISENNYFVARVYVKCSLKKGYVATLQTKDSLIAASLNINKSDYIHSTKGEFYEFYLTNFDIMLLMKHYNAEIEFISYYQFEKVKGLFTNYIMPYKFKKENAKNNVEKLEAKIMLNSLYGKFGSRVIQRQKIAKIENGVNKFSFGEYEEVEPNYIPTAIFITSIARFNIISDAQKNFKNFLYADTDSLHMINDKSIKLNIDDKEFGKWKLEGNFVKAKYLRAKLYIEQKQNGDLEVKGAGMTAEIKSQVNFDNFEYGSVFKGKKATKQVKGGVVIYETEFSINKNQFFL